MMANINFKGKKLPFTSLPLLNSLNQVPGFSFGHDEILTCERSTETRVITVKTRKERELTE